MLRGLGSRYRMVLRESRRRDKHDEEPGHPILRRGYDHCSSFKSIVVEVSNPPCLQCSIFGLTEYVCNRQLSINKMASTQRGLVVTDFRRCAKRDSSWMLM